MNEKIEWYKAEILASITDYRKTQDQARGGYTYNYYNGKNNGKVYIYPRRIGHIIGVLNFRWKMEQM